MHIFMQKASKRLIFYLFLERFLMIFKDKNLDIRDIGIKMYKFSQETSGIKDQQTWQTKTATSETSFYKEENNIKKKKVASTCRHLSRI